MKRTPKQSVVVVRDGKAVTPPMGEPFEFTEEEVEQITKMNPDALSAEAVVDLTKAEAAAPAPAPAAGGKKPAAGSTETL